MLLGDILEHGAETYADKPALIFDSTTTSTFTFADILERSAQLSEALRATHQPGDRVAILSQNRTEYVEAYFGVPMAGLTLTLLNYRLSARELAGILADSGSRTLLVEGPYASVGQELLNGVDTLERLIVIDPEAPLEDATTYESLLQSGGDVTTFSSDGVTDADLAFLIYTSGTTGTPKGAGLTHRNLAAGMIGWLIASGKKNGDGVDLMPFPMCHIAGFGLVGSMLLGHTQVLQRAYDPVRFMSAVQTFGVTGAPMAPTMLSALMAHPEFDDFDLSTLEEISYGGSSMPVEILREAMSKFPNASFIQGYGMTELGTSVLCLDATAHRLAVAGREDLLACAGRPVPTTRVRLVDEWMNPVATGEVGEIVVKGDNVMTLYWGRPDATAESFTDGWFHTGDLGRATEDGYIAVVDRLKDMIVTGGENVYSREVEDIIYQHPGVAEAAVIGVPDPKWGENVCAVIVKKPGAEFDESEIIDLCRSQLAGYKAPKVVRFADELPHNAAGKILKKSLRDLV